MSKYWTLTKILLKTSSNSLIKESKRATAKTIAMIILLAFSFLPLVAMLIGMSVVSYDVLAKVNQQGMVLAFGMSISCTLIFVFGIFYVMSTFYFSMDIEPLLPMPLKPSQIIMAKFTVVLIYEYLTELVFMLPVLITYGIKSSGGPIYYIYALITYVTLPIIPLVMCSILVMIIMRFSNIARNKDRFRAISGIMAIFLGIGLNIFIQKTSRGVSGDKQILELYTSGNNSLVKTSLNLFPSARLAVNAMIYNGELKGIINMLLYIVITLALMEIVILLGEAIYFKGVIGGEQSTSKKKKLTEKELTEGLKQNSALKSYIIKELKILFRTPTYFLNCILMKILYPVFFLIPVFTTPDFGSELKKVNVFFQNQSILNIILTACFAFILFLSATNPTAPTAISREGKILFVSKYLPVSYKVQIMAKTLTAVILDLIGVIVMIVISAIILKPPVYFMLLVLITGILAMFFMSFMGIIIDLNHPKLIWEDEQRAVKQNMNVLLNMVIGIVVGGITTVSLITLQFSLWITFLVLVIVYSIINIILYNIISSTGVKLLRKLEG